MPKSRLVKLNDYALLELTYEESTINTDSSGFTIIDNTIQAYLQVLNDNNSSKATGNVLDRSSVQIGTNQWVRTEQDVAIPYLSTDQRFDVTSLATEAPLLQWNVTYDRVRVHILLDTRLLHRAVLFLRLRIQRQTERRTPGFLWRRMLTETIT